MNSSQMEEANCYPLRKGNPYAIGSFSAGTQRWNNLDSMLIQRQVESTLFQLCVPTGKYIYARIISLEGIFILLKSSCCKTP